MAAVLVIASGDSAGCALAPRAGDSVLIAEESAVIVWDAATKTQHFIRRAQFDSKAGDFGFLVPTPSRPTLAEANDAVFRDLATITRPPPGAAPLRSDRSGTEVARAAAAPPVVVLETATVAGLDAAVLAASEAGALDRWLREHGYVSSPALTEWFRPYVAAKWIVTAFKISKGASSAQRTATSAVRMSFRTERPFFPYREPPAPGTGARLLELFVLAGERVEASLGAVAGWPGRALWARPLKPGPRAQLLAQLKLADAVLPGKVWLTRFMDTSRSRPGSDDLYFTRSPDQSEFIDARGLEEAELRKAKLAQSAPSAKPDYAVELMIVRADDLELEGKYAEAARVLRSAARQGSGKAAARLGDYYDKGRPGIRRDFSESLQWYERARQLGEPVDAAGKR